ncbi:hypothetical protein Poli38472_009625 [Pythium oligandrum]|uniref:Prolyl 4-hydroxylase alpha subunit Fe(2+) 2OG dioxygenase domain-containing protein n=1 Tax=Pythium oligandrum TaxID=41045 RepID=A0A8K1FJT0_PYTOL|nr:hypothetical protein Poli38472_009625 [Pythium oligandrum]|eukprot:TMW62132.1 hypothetical protein Poli38472_009625 [Pythium oligandrum]
MEGTALQRVSKALTAVKQPPTFFSSGVTSEAADPQLRVLDVGDVTLPLTAESARSLIKRGSPAPFGHAKKYYIKEYEQYTWEFPPSDFELRNPEWQAMVDDIALECVASMGVEGDASVRANLTKLLVYEKKGECVYHQEPPVKNPPFATLMIVLPTEYTGGELVVRPPGFDSKAREWTRDAGVGRVQYVAFYSDCFHKVQPIQDGYRLCLVYDLMVALNHEDVPSVDPEDPVFVELSSAIDAYFETPESKGYSHNLWKKKASSLWDKQPPGGLVIALDHKYVETSDFGWLKNKDRIVAQYLAQYCARHQASYGLYLCGMTFTCKIDPNYRVEEDEHENEVELKTWHRSPHDGAKSIGVPKGLKNFSPDFNSEVAPIRRLARPRIRFDDGYTYETHRFADEEERVNVYDGSVLALVPLESELKLYEETGAQCCIAPMVSLAESENPHLDKFVRTIFNGNRYEWSTASFDFRMAVDFFRDHYPEDLDLHIALAKSTQFVEFQPKIRDLIPEDQWEAFTTRLIEAVLANINKNYRAMVNLICSLLDGETDPKRIQLVFDTVAIETHKTEEKTDRSVYTAALLKNDIRRDVSNEELIRMLKLALHAPSMDTMRKCLVFSTISVPNVIIPAFFEFVESLESPTDYECVVICARALRKEVKSHMQNETVWAVDGLDTPCDLNEKWFVCKECTVLHNFLQSEHEQELQMRITGVRRRHLELFIKKNASKQLSYRVEKSGRPHLFVITKLQTNTARHATTKEMLKKLKTLIPAKN